MPSDPITRLALSMANSPGVYALLIGSGVSTGAGMPTGWGVQVALMRRVATADNAEVDLQDEEALEKWWTSVNGREPTYSAMLEELAATQAERQATLRQFFVPTEEERRAGVKLPGRAHEAVARLVASGAVRVILTTNFDTLIEQALAAKNVDHDVWASPEEIIGGIPLEHGRTVVVKLHGDYRRTNLRNTLRELSEYPGPIDDLLDRVFDAFGVVVCGWSADHDIALRKAIERATNRRYSWSWSILEDEPPEPASNVIKHRDAHVIPGHTADVFFRELADRHAAVQGRGASATERLVTRHVTADRAADRSQRHQLLQSVLETATGIRDALSDEERFPRLVGTPTAQDVLASAGALVELSRPLIDQLTQVIAIADEDIAFDVVNRVAEMLADVDWNLGLSRVPLLLAWYGLGIIAVDNDRLDLLRRIATQVLIRDPEQVEPLAASVHPWVIVDDDEAIAQWLANGGPTNTRLHAPMSRWLERSVLDLVEALPVTATKDRWRQAFDRFEWAAGLLLAGLAHRRKMGVGPLVPPPHVGSFGWRRDYLFEQPRWASLIAWGDDHAEMLLADFDAGERTAIRDKHLAQVHEVAGTWY